MSHWVPHDKTKTKEQSDCKVNFRNGLSHLEWDVKRAVTDFSPNMFKQKLNVLLYLGCCRDIHDLGKKHHFWGPLQVLLIDMYQKLLKAFF